MPTPDEQHCETLRQRGRNHAVHALTFLAKHALSDAPSSVAEAKIVTCYCASQFFAARLMQAYREGSFNLLSSLMLRDVSRHLQANGVNVRICMVQESSVKEEESRGCNRETEV